MLFLRSTRALDSRYGRWFTLRIPRKLLFISLPMFNSTAMERKKLNLCLYLDKFHCLLSSTSFLFVKQHKIFYEEQFINQHSNSSNRELFPPADGGENTEKVKTGEINKSTRARSVAFFSVENIKSLLSWNKNFSERQLLFFPSRPTSNETSFPKSRLS